MVKNLYQDIKLRVKTKNDLHLAGIYWVLFCLLHLIYSTHVAKASV